MAPKRNKKRKGRGSKACPPEQDPPEGTHQAASQAYPPPGRGPHWANVRTLAEEALTAAAAGSDEELQLEILGSETALQARFEAYMEQRHDAEESEEGADDDTAGEGEGPATNTTAFAIELAARLIDRTGREPFETPLSGRLAVLYLARADWDLELAVDTAVENLNLGDDEMILDAEDEAIRGDTLTGTASEEQSVLQPQPVQPTLTIRPQTRPLTAEQTAMLHLNPNVNRDAARVGVPTPDSFTITLAQPTGQPNVFTFNHAANFDWSSTAAIRALNKWRAQVFLRALGSKQPARLPFLPRELTWLAEYIRNAHATVTTTHNLATFDLSVLDWSLLTDAFNLQFQGQRIEGSDQLRPERTMASLRAELGRIEEVVRLTGMAVKGALRR